MLDEYGIAYARYCEASVILTRLPWRHGRENPCDIYAIIPGSSSWKDDIPIGHFNTPELAAESIKDHNAEWVKNQSG